MYSNILTHPNLTEEQQARYSTMFVVDPFKQAHELSLRGVERGYYHIINLKTGEHRSVWFDADDIPPPPEQKEHEQIYYGIAGANKQGSPYERVTNDEIIAVNQFYADFDVNWHLRGTDHHTYRIDDYTADDCYFLKFPPEAHEPGYDVEDYKKEIKAKDFYFIDPQAIKDHIETLPIRPNLIVFTGGGYQCNWFLDEPFVIGNDSDRERITDDLSLWHKLINSDPLTTGIGQPLRVPNTLNYKEKYGPNHPEARVVYQDLDNLYTLDELESEILKLRKDRKPKQSKQSKQSQTPKEGTSPYPASLRYVEKALSYILNTLANAEPNGSEKDVPILEAGRSIGNLEGADWTDKSLFTGILDRVLEAVDDNSSLVQLSRKEVLKAFNNGRDYGMHKPQDLPDFYSKEQTNLYEETCTDPDPLYWPLSEWEVWSEEMKEQHHRMLLEQEDYEGDYGKIVRERQETFTTSSSYGEWIAREHPELNVQREKAKKRIEKKIVAIHLDDIWYLKRNPNCPRALKCCISSGESAFRRDTNASNYMRELKEMDTDLTIISTDKKERAKVVKKLNEEGTDYTVFPTGKGEYDILIGGGVEGGTPFDPNGPDAHKTCQLWSENIQGERRSGDLIPNIKELRAKWGPIVRAERQLGIAEVLTTGDDPDGISIPVLNIKTPNKPAPDKAYEKDVYTLEDYKEAQWQVSLYTKEVNQGTSSLDYMFLKSSMLDEVIKTFDYNNKELRKTNGSFKKIEKESVPPNEMASLKRKLSGKQ